MSLLFIVPIKPGSESFMMKQLRKRKQREADNLSSQENSAKKSISISVETASPDANTATEQSSATDENTLTTPKSVATINLFASPCPKVTTEIPANGYELKKVESQNNGYPLDDDFSADRHHKYTKKHAREQYSSDKNNAHQNFLNFLKKYEQHGLTGINMNTEANPFQLFSINTHQDFCDRNDKYLVDKNANYQTANLQCCGQATRAANMSMIFVGQTGEKTQTKTYLNPSNDTKAFNFYKRCTPVDKTKEDTIDLDSYTINNPSIIKAAEAFSKLHMKCDSKRSLVVNLAIFTCNYQSTDPKTFGILSYNGLGIKSDPNKITNIETHDILSEIKKELNITEIHTIPYADAVSIGMRGRRKKTKCYEKILEHCETVAADCISRFFETGKINASGKFIPSETENCENTNNIESNSPRQLLF